MKSGELSETSTVYWDRVSQNILSMGAGAALVTMFPVRPDYILPAVVILLGINVLINFLINRWRVRHTS
jgi:hypothetical protein